MDELEEYLVKDSEAYETDSNCDLQRMQLQKHMNVIQIKFNFTGYIYNQFTHPLSVEVLQDTTG